MTCLERILSRLADTGLYRLEEDSWVYAEVKAYAQGIQLLLDEIGRLRYGAFFHLPQSPCARLQEQLFGFDPTPVNGQGDTPFTGEALQRRERIIAACQKRLAVSRQYATADQLEQAVESWGCTVEFGEVQNQDTLWVTLTPDELIAPDPDALQRRVKGLLPYWKKLSFH